MKLSDKDVLEGKRGCRNNCILANMIKREHGFTAVNVENGFMTPCACPLPLYAFERAAVIEPKDKAIEVQKAFDRHSMLSRELLRDYGHIEFRLVPLDTEPGKRLAKKLG